MLCLVLVLAHTFSNAAHIITVDTVGIYKVTEAVLGLYGACRVVAFCCVQVHLSRPSEVSMMMLMTNDVDGWSSMCQIVGIVSLTIFIVYNCIYFARDSQFIQTSPRMLLGTSN